MATKERRKKKSQNLGYQQEPYPKENELIEKQVLLAVQQSPETEKKEDVSTIQFSRQDQGVKSSLPTPEDKIDIKALKVSKTVVSPILDRFLEFTQEENQRDTIKKFKNHEGLRKEAEKHTKKEKKDTAVDFLLSKNDNTGKREKFTGTDDEPKSKKIKEEKDIEKVDCSVLLPDEDKKFEEMNSVSVHMLLNDAVANKKLLPLSTSSRIENPQNGNIYYVSIPNDKIDLNKAIEEASKLDENTWSLMSKKLNINNTLEEQYPYVQYFYFKTCPGRSRVTSTGPNTKYIFLDSFKKQILIHYLRENLKPMNMPINKMQQTIKPEIKVELECQKEKKNKKSICNQHDILDLFKRGKNTIPTKPGNEYLMNKLKVNVNTFKQAKGNVKNTQVELCNRLTRNKINYRNDEPIQMYIEEILLYNTEQQQGHTGTKFNVPYQMVACIPKYMPLQISQVPVHTLDNILDEIPMETLRLFVNHGSIYEFEDKNSQIQKFALYSPRIGTCVLLTEEGKIAKNEIYHHAARSVKDGALRKSTKEANYRDLTRLTVVFREKEWIQADTLESKVQEYMSTVPVDRVPTLSSPKDLQYCVFMTCYCNEPFETDKSKGEWFVRCQGCSTRYHNNCLTKEETSSTEPFICVPCSPKPEIVWSHNKERCSYTCPLNNFLQAATLHFMEHPQILEKLDGSNPENSLIKTCIEQIQQLQHDQSQLDSSLLLLLCTLLLFLNSPESYPVLT